MICHNWSRLRNISGYSRRRFETILACQATVMQKDLRDEFQENLRRRADARKAFLQANISRAIRAAPATRNQPIKKELNASDSVCHWGSVKDDSTLHKCYWRGLKFMSHQ